MPRPKITATSRSNLIRKISRPKNVSLISKPAADRLISSNHGEISDLEKPYVVDGRSIAIPNRAIDIAILACATIAVTSLVTPMILSKVKKQFTGSLQ